MYLLNVKLQIFVLNVVHELFIKCIQMNWLSVVLLAWLRLTIELWFLLFHMKSPQTKPIWTRQSYTDYVQPASLHRPRTKAVQNQAFAMTKQVQTRTKPCLNYSQHKNHPKPLMSPRMVRAPLFENHWIRQLLYIVLGPRLPCRSHCLPDPFCIPACYGSSTAVTVVDTLAPFSPLSFNCFFGLCRAGGPRTFLPPLCFSDWPWPLVAVTHKATRSACKSFAGVFCKVVWGQVAHVSAWEDKSAYWVTKDCWIEKESLAFDITVFSQFFISYISFWHCEKFFSKESIINCLLLNVLQISAYLQMLLLYSFIVIVLFQNKPICTSSSKT